MNGTWNPRVCLVEESYPLGLIWDSFPLLGLLGCLVYEIHRPIASGANCSSFHLDALACPLFSSTLPTPFPSSFSKPMSERKSIGVPEKEGTVYVMVPKAVVLEHFSPGPLLRMKIGLRPSQEVMS